MINQLISFIIIYWLMFININLRRYCTPPSRIIEVGVCQHHQHLRRQYMATCNLYNFRWLTHHPYNHQHHHHPHQHGIHHKPSKWLSGRGHKQLQENKQQQDEMFYFYRFCNKNDKPAIEPGSLRCITRLCDKEADGVCRHLVAKKTCLILLVT